MRLAIKFRLSLPNCRFGYRLPLELVRFTGSVREEDSNLSLFQVLLKFAGASTALRPDFPRRSDTLRLSLAALRADG